MDNGQTFLQSETDFNRLSKWITAGINRSEGFSRDSSDVVGDNVRMRPATAARRSGNLSPLLVTPVLPKYASSTISPET